MKTCRHVLLLPLLVLAGCATTGGSDVENNDAARYNTRLAAAYLDRGEPDLAMEKVEKALEQDDEFAEAYLVKGMILARAEEYGEADDYYEDAVRYGKDNHAILGNVAAYWCERGRYRDGEKLFLEVARQPTYARPAVAYANAGLCARRVPDMARAEQHFRKALELEPAYRLALWHMASLSLDQGEHLAARGFLQRLEGVQRLGPDGLFLGVRIERALNDVAAARRYADILLRDFPESEEARRLAKSPERN